MSLRQAILNTSGFFSITSLESRGHGQGREPRRSSHQRMAEPGDRAGSSPVLPRGRGLVLCSGGGGAVYLCRAEKRLLGDSRMGPLGRP